MSTEFKRENRYIVIKRSDLDKLYKDPTKYATTFGHALALIAPHLPKRQFLVIESDWPEYEPVWKMIEARMTGAPVALQADAQPMTEFDPDSVCIDADGCPTESAVLKRFWRANQPDAALCKFYEVDGYPGLVRELVGHVAQLQDAAKRNVKPWEDTFPPTLLPAYIERVNAANEVEQQEPIAVEPVKCTWAYSEHEFSWDTQCGQKWSFTDGGTPTENGMNFCHSCGKGLTFVEPEEAEE